MTPRMRPDLSQGAETSHVSPLRFYAALVSLTWWLIVWGICAIGVTQLFRYYWTRPLPAACVTAMKEADVPRVTVIRPVSGLDPRLYECLASSLRQTYPAARINNVFCVASRDDPAYPILERLVRDFPHANVHITVEDEDPLLANDRSALGPNPKIRNMSRAYREAKGALVWILDCNVWVGPGVGARFVDLLCGYSTDARKPKTKFKFVHQTPLTVDLDSQSLSLEQRKELLGGAPADRSAATAAAASSESAAASSAWQRVLQRAGARLDEAFMSSAHAKFYQAINTVKVAPCIMGKSTMFRRAHLDAVTAGHPVYAPGIDAFSDNICEDHLIGDALWKRPQPFEKPGYAPPPGENVDTAGPWGNHEMLFGDFCFQPISHTPLAAYLARRIRWLRVRKYTVTLATLVEPGTEAFACGAYGAFGLTTLPVFRPYIAPSWTAFALIWLAHCTLWCAVDWVTYLLLHSAKTVEVDSETPDFVLPLPMPTSPASSSPAISPPNKPPADTSPLLAHQQHQQPPLRAGARRSFPEFLAAWCGRELFALPIWIVAFWGGATVEWRGRRFYVGFDTKVREIGGESGGKGVVDGKAEGAKGKPGGKSEGNGKAKAEGKGKGKTRE
ncbi:ceramide glucosyltransferas-like protein [Boeremia exigua]|uniref:ceramide glucosyltransferase-like protein n=1 Tax=Boeremia exigua TaxID=749465 RepID=UPI001E8D221E|nr:ceramide glucosyltransferase-like protein [Boeremia exigua]KAH6638947.1 ceramide glucosyltransferas-like protein [Boeremia exigua]